jgi:beta-N-acetylhexosaminidase
MTLEELIGQRLVFGIPGTHITPEIVRHFKETHCGGLILYRINFEYPDQLRQLISDLENALQRRLLVTADMEGGRVIMFREGITVFPSNQALGQTGNTQYARAQGEQEGRELRRLGIDVNFAPVLDVLTEDYSPNIGIRAYGKDPELVAKMGAARLAAMQVEGLSACAKHFPGLGPATLDPHLQLPTILMSWPELEKVHLTPFYRAMRTAVHSMMTSHPLYPNLDPTPKTPATFSRKIVREFLRQKTGYKGVIFSDDLEMGAITALCPIGEAAVRATEAGHDVVLACHDMNAQRAVYEALLEAYKSKRLLQKELEESVQRVENLKAKRTTRFAEQPGTPARAQREQTVALELVKELCEKSVTVLQDGPSPRADASTAVIFPRLSDLDSRIMIEKELLDEAAFWKNRLEPLGLKAQVVLYGLDPMEAEIQSAVAAAESHEQTLLFIFDAHIHAAQKVLLESLQAKGKPLAVILLRDVYDLAYVQKNSLCVTNYGFRICDLDVITQKLFAKRLPPLAGTPSDPQIQGERR